MSIILQFILTIAFIALVSFLLYKTVLPLCLKIIDLSLKSSLFRKSSSLLLALAFGVVGIFQLIDFLHGIEQSMTMFFPLSFLASTIFIDLSFARSKT